MWSKQVKIMKLEKLKQDKTKTSSKMSKTDFFEAMFQLLSHIIGANMKANIFLPNCAYSSFFSSYAKSPYQTLFES